MIDNNIKDILLNATTIAIIGLSPNHTKDSHIVAKYLKNRNYKIIPIYPKEDFILNSKVYRNLNDAILESIDIVVMFRKSEFGEVVANEIINFNLKNPSIKLFWMQLEIQNNKAKEILEKNNINVVQNKCIQIELINLNK